MSQPNIDKWPEQSSSSEQTQTSQESTNTSNQEQNKSSELNQVNNQQPTKTKVRKPWSTKKKFFFVIGLIIFTSLTLMTLFSIHVEKPDISRVQDVSEENFVFEVEYYLVQLDF